MVGRKGEYEELVSTRGDTQCSLLTNPGVLGYCAGVREGYAALFAQKIMWLPAYNRPRLLSGLKERMKRLVRA